MDILVMLGIAVAVGLIILGLFMMLRGGKPASDINAVNGQAGGANNQQIVDPSALDEHLLASTAQIELPLEPEPEPMTARDFITKTIEHPVVVPVEAHADVHLTDQPVERPVDHQVIHSVESVAIKQDMHGLGGLDAILDDLEQATSHTDFPVLNEVMAESASHDALATAPEIPEITTAERSTQHEVSDHELSDFEFGVGDPLTDSAGTSTSAEVLAIDTAQLSEWQGESALLDEHLADHSKSEEDSILVQAEQIIALHLLPKTGRAMDGRMILRLLRQHGLRFGEMSLFHRFEETSGQGPMMFSVLKYTQEGPAGFDLDTMEQEAFDGLSFFLALPGIQPLKGFDMMISTAQRLAQECYAQLFDEDMNALSEQLKTHYRHRVLDFRPSHL